MALKRRDWALLAIAAGKGKPLAPVQLQKVLFIFGKRRAKDVEVDYYNFRAYRYGPFDVGVYSDAEILASEGRVLLSQPGSRWKTYAITQAGSERAKELRDTHPELERSCSYLERLVDWAISLSFQDLVKAVYEEFPEMKANSEFWEPKG